ncbi:LOW QUALITY PROTEIN: NFX1-type zinc finger-containing protein 1-like [Pecten maximus]|uniref:LOW QUALITY PROTEIN: NFX1-type zinc finger-containing protein 1-like n=1 Tax=Pecten maximus TaxID=6579 RepID=UPI00145859A6|nr:LOW QUALITY PROTEIN: NFX1-type zinc finger-containing protein 1-like [Pecten maximus]
MAVPKQTHIFTNSQLNEFLSESRTCADVLVSLCTTERPRTEVTLSRPGHAPNYVTQMVAVLLKAAQSTDAAGVIDLLSVLVGSNFFMKELVVTSSSLVNNTEEEEGLKLMTNLVELLKQVSCRLPSSFANAFGLIIILQKRIEDILLTAEGERRICVVNLSETLGEMRDNVLKRMVTHSNDNPRLPFEKQAPPNDFRNIPILPRVSDIFLGSRSAFLRKNKARGGYDNLQHYLDVQFRLYREDCISPLREGITQYVQEVSVGHSVRRLQDGRLYKNVIIEYVEHSVEGQMYKVRLDPGHAKRIKWKSSRRLLYGSLLCLSADSFHTMVFAVVAESEREDLMNDHSFKIVFPSEVGEVRLPSNATFTMVESTAYFEAYRHVLVGLQRLEDGELPFEKYIVRCMTDVERPLYLNNEYTDYDLHPIVKEESIFKHGLRSDRRLYVDVNDPISQWPSAEQLHLDPSQFEAFHAALTQEFVLIQGPPGTGKTHVGLQIAKALLHNRDVWQGNHVRRHTNIRNMSLETKEQMLVVCYTNHALDQFMEGIVQFLDKDNKTEWREEIVRVGGRSENEAMDEFSLKSRRHRHHRSRYERAEQDRKLDQLYKFVTRLHQRISFIAYSLCHLNDTILDVELLSAFMLPHHVQFFFENTILSPEKLYRWLEADEKTVLRKSHNAYKKTSKMAKSSSVNAKQIPTPEEANEDQHEEDEAKKVEDDRRIEDDVFSVEFQEDIGLDIGKQIKDVLLNLNSNQLVDEHFQSLLQREAQITLAKLSSSDKMDEKDARNINSLKKMRLERRWQLYRYWVDLYKQHQTQQTDELEKEYYDTIKVYEKEKKEVDAEILKASTVIGMTTTGAARYQDILKEIGPRIVIVEEAAEVLEAHIVTALSPRCEHLILIGDHKQLEPKPSVMQLALKYNLSLSMFERMLNNGIKNHCLQRQHRMRPEISSLVRGIYDVLEDNENVLQYEHIMGVRKDVFFINHNQTEDYADDIRSYSNKHEAQYVANLCTYLLKQGYKGTQITVLAAYTGQMFCIRDCMPRQEFEGVRTVAIDNFQGEENDIILLSIVRSNNEGKIGFLSRENRICVALSRAKKGLYVIGNFNMFQSGNKRWADVVQKVKLAGQFGKSLPLYCQNHPDAEGVQAEDASDFRKSPDGGCQMKCDFRLSCGHACRFYCHPIDSQHIKYVCRRPCEKKCENDHICKRKCHFDDDCNCPIKMTKDLPCGHIADMECCISTETFRCDVVVERKLRCGHLANIKCHTDTETYKCKIIVTRTLESCSHLADMQCCKIRKSTCRTVVTRTLDSCKHEAEMECCLDIKSYKCKITVNRILPSCGHEADMECYRTPESIKCAKTLTKTRERCGHSYDVRCSHFNSFYELRHPCEESVTKSWACQHTKVMKCHESVQTTCKDKCLKICDQNHTCRKICHFPSSCKCDVEMKKMIPTCGHTQDIPCHKDPANVDCRTKVMKRLTSCNHEMMMECSEDPSSYRFSKSCDALVSKTVPSCNHTQTMKCSESPIMYRCKEIVGKPHPMCGHTVQLECYASPGSSTKCDTIVSKQLPCGHNREMKCSEAKSLNVGLFLNKSRTDYQCNTDVDYTLTECGHRVIIPCHVKTHLERQTTSVRLKRSLQKQLPTCKTPVVKKFVCGHSIKIECSLLAQQTCSSNCSKEMACGHACPRKCTQCFNTLTHGDCNEPCGKRQICGHECTSTTCGSCAHCCKQCANFCPHHRCDHPCFRECTPCMEKCSLQCPHHSCSRLCHEECDRPPCDQPCQRLLKCKHPCMGYCGDPCPTLCLVCEPTKWSDFNDEWFSVGDIRIVRLEDCGHEHGAVHLDKLFAKESTTLSLLCCPKCETVIRRHPRYANRLKKQQRNVAAIKLILANGLEDFRMERLFPTLCGGVEETRSYLQRFNTYLFLQSKLKGHQDVLQRSYSWSISTTDQLTTFLGNLRISAAITHQETSSINRVLTKLSATWLLHLANTHDTDLSSSDSEEESNLFENSKRGERKKEKLRTVTETNVILHDVDDLIRESGAFDQTELGKVQNTLGVLLSDQSEVNQVMKSPRLQTIGVHTDDWFICSKGHVGSTACREETCIQCVTGIPLASTYELFWGKWRANFETAKNGGNSGRGSRRNRRGNRRGGDGVERGGHASGSAGRGVEIGEHRSEKGRTNVDERIIPTEPVYMASPHQRNFEHGKKGRGGQAADRGRGRGNFRGSGLDGWWSGGHDTIGMSESGFGREGVRSNVLGNRGSASIGIRGGFKKERGGTGKKGAGDQEVPKEDEEVTEEDKKAREEDKEVPEEDEEKEEEEEGTVEEAGVVEGKDILR